MTLALTNPPAWTDEAREFLPLTFAYDEPRCADTDPEEELEEEELEDDELDEDDDEFWDDEDEDDCDDDEMDDEDEDFDEVDDVLDELYTEIGGEG